MHQPKINAVKVPANYWWPILESKRLPKQGALGIKRFGRRLALWRGSDSQIHCVDDRCPHRGTAFTQPKDFPRNLNKVPSYCATLKQREKEERLGFVFNNQIQCQYHGLSFDGKGKCHKLPFARNPTARVPKSMCTKPYQAREQEGCIWLWWGDSQADAEIPWYDFLPSKRHMACFTSQIPHWNYLRGIEQMLDTFHFPVLHKSTAQGFGLGGPILTRFKSWEAGSGRQARIMVDMKLSEADGQTKKMKLHQETIFPHTVCSSFLKNDPQKKTKIYFVASQVPVDNETTYVFYRYYYDSRTVLWAKLVAKLLLHGETSMVSGEDVRAVTSQFPNDGVGTNILLEPDKAYMLYERRWLREIAEHHDQQPNVSWQPPTCAELN